MTNITFLHGASNRLQAAAIWLSQITAEQKPVLVFAPTGDRGSQLSQLLWAHPATSFTPHCRSADNLAAETPIVIAPSLHEPPHHGCLLNLSDDIPDGFSRFEQLIEIVSVEAGDRAAGRERYRFYRERGYPMESREINAGV